MEDDSTVVPCRYCSHEPLADTAPSMSMEIEWGVAWISYVFNA